MANITAHIDNEVGLNKFYSTILQDLKLVNSGFSSGGRTIGEYIGDYIIEAIGTKHPIGQFMGPRTALTVVSGENMLDVQISGTKEADGYNLWEAHEFGYNTGDISGRLMVFDVGGETVFTTSRQGVEVVKYKGQIAKILDEEYPEIDSIARGFAAIAANAQLKEMVKTASGGQVVLAETIGLSELGIMPATLQAIGAVSVYVNPSTMRVSYRGAGGRFIAAQGLPTRASIKKSF